MAGPTVTCAGNPSLDFIQRAAEALDVSVAELFGSESKAARGMLDTTRKMIEGIEISVAALDPVADARGIAACGAAQPIVRRVVT